jgi:hypothetical protein
MHIHPRVDAMTALAFMVLPDGAALQPRRARCIAGITS